MVVESQRRLDSWFRAHHGVITRAKARQLGLSDAAIRTQLRNGLWLCRFPNTYVLASAAPGPLVDLTAALAALGPEAVTSHGSAAWLWGLMDRPPIVVHVTMPAGTDHRPAGVRVHRAKARVPRASRQGFACTTPGRTLCDLAAVGPPEEVTRMVERALAHKLVTISRLREDATTGDGHARAGGRLLIRILEDLGLCEAPAPSVLESEMRRLFRRFELPVPKAEVRWGPDGEYRLDYAYPDRKLAIETDGYTWHSSPSQLERDHHRRNRLVSDGWVILVYTWREVRQDPARVAREILAAYLRLDPQTAPKGV